VSSHRGGSSHTPGGIRPPPLLVTATSTEFIDTEIGAPLGVADNAYGSITMSLPQGSTVIAFTDGLVERRDEMIDVGLERLASGD
jgi:serine phosphatase RsbU (regulator of sigma subunit)